MGRVLVVGGAIIVTLAYGLWLSVERIGKLNEQLKQKNVDLNVIQGQLDALQERIEKTRKNSKAAKEMRREIRNENPDWVAVPVPDSVVDSLCAKAYCADQAGEM